MRLNNGSYVYKMEVPVTVQYHKRKDGSVSIDTVSVPREDELYDIVDTHAGKIKQNARLRAGNLKRAGEGTR